jgi:hypothetical protein
MATVPGNLSEFGAPGAGLGGPPVAETERTLGSRLGQAGVLLVLAALAGGLTFAMAHEVGLAAVTGRKAVAHATHCRGVKARTCDAEVTDAAGNTIAYHASVSGFTRVESNALVHVRYRGGRAAPDTLPERGAQLGLLVLFGGGAVGALVGSVATLAGRGGRVALIPVGLAVCAVPVMLISLFATLVVGAPTVGAGSPKAGAGSVTGGAGAPPVSDIYARVAAEPGRGLTAQGVHFDLVDNQALSREGCFRAPGCFAGAVAHWKVTGTDLVATSHLLVFDRPAQAAALKAAITRDRGLPDAPPPPAGSVVIGIGTGRYASAIWVSRADGSVVAADPQAHPALRALAYFNIDPAVAEGIRYGRKP